MGTSNAGKVTGSLWRRCSEPHTTEKWVWPNSLREGDGHPDMCSQVESLLYYQLHKLRISKVQWMCHPKKYLYYYHVREQSDFFPSFCDSVQLEVGLLEVTEKVKVLQEGLENRYNGICFHPPSIHPWNLQVLACNGCNNTFDLMDIYFAQKKKKEKILCFFLSKIKRVAIP